MRTLLLILLTFQLSGQKMSEYMASNGVTYKKGDKIELSVINYSKYKHIRFPALLQGGVCCPDASYGARSYTITKIRKNQFGFSKDSKKVEIYTKGFGTPLIIDIEAALKTCEVECIQTIKFENVSESNPDKYDQLRKLKSLLDDGIISKEEYLKEKESILSKK